MFYMHLDLEAAKINFDVCLNVRHSQTPNDT